MSRKNGKDLAHPPNAPDLAHSKKNSRTMDNMEVPPAQQGNSVVESKVVNKVGGDCDARAIRWHCGRSYNCLTMM
jgi:hypothetical protein